MGKEIERAAGRLAVKNALPKHRTVEKKSPKAVSGSPAEKETEKSVSSEKIIEMMRVERTPGVDVDEIAAVIAERLKEAAFNMQE